MVSQIYFDKELYMF